MFFFELRKFVGEIYVSDLRFATRTDFTHWKPFSLQTMHRFTFYQILYYFLEMQASFYNLLYLIQHEVDILNLINLLTNTNSSHSWRTILLCIILSSCSFYKSCPNIFRFVQSNNNVCFI